MSARRMVLVLVLTAALLPAVSRAARQDTPAATPKVDHAVGYYDPELQRVVIVGAPGDPRDGERDSVWSWSGRQWDLVTRTGPVGRVNAAAVFDARGRRAIVSGGSRKSADGASWRVVGDNWAGGPSDWKPITEMTPLDHQSLAVDDRDDVVMFGGIGADRAGAWPGETWRLEGDAFTRVATGGPAARGRTAMAYDARRRQVVLFAGVSAPSGSDQSQTFFGDTWIWQDRKWRKAADSGPRGRYAHGMVFDERAGVVLLYSGAGAHRGAPLEDMWQWDGGKWTEIPLTGPTPGFRYQPVMVYDRARQKTVLVGGIGGPADTWEWDGQHWSRVG